MHTSYSTFLSVILDFTSFMPGCLHTCKVVGKLLSDHKRLIASKAQQLRAAVVPPLLVRLHPDNVPVCTALHSAKLLPIHVI